MLSFVFFFLSWAHADFVANIDTKGLLAQLSKTGMCHDSQSARVCRQLHWVPSKDEGVVNFSNVGYVFMKLSSFESSYPGNLWRDKVPTDKNYQYYSFLMAARKSFASALIASGFPIVYLFFLEGEGAEYKPKSIFLAASQDLLSFAIQHEDSINKEFDKPITEWIPPDDFEKIFQFKVIE